MCSPCPEPSRSFAGRVLLGFALAAFVSDLAAASRVLRVAADPNNLPFTNERREGFENRLADLVAAELGAELQYVWRPQRRGFVRNTLNAGEADVVLGVPVGFELLLTTRPYYRSTYVFVARRDGEPPPRSLDDPRLRKLKIGVQLIGDDFANIPPAHSLSSRGIITNVRGYTVYGNYAEENPPARIIRAVATGELDLAIAWGPLASFFARRESVPLQVAPVPPDPTLPFLPFSYGIAMGVKRGNTALRDELDGVLQRRADEITRLLEEFGVPRAEAPPGERRVGHVER